MPLERVLVLAAILAFPLVPHLCQGTQIEAHMRLISRVKKLYSASSVFFIRSNSFQDVRFSSLMHLWSREFSGMGVLFQAMNFSTMTRSYHLYTRVTVRPLYVILLTDNEALWEFVRLTEAMRASMWHPVWLVIFAEEHGRRPFENLCLNPGPNIFHLSFSTQMVVRCYDWPVMREWYAVEDNVTRTTDYLRWDSTSGTLTTLTFKSLYKRRSNLFNKTLRIVTLKGSRLIWVSNDTLHGLFGSIFTELSKALNFRVEILEAQNTYGSYSISRRGWTGVIKQLARGEADVGLGGFTMTNRRLDVVDFTLPLIHSPNRLYIRRPGGAAVQWSSYFKAFDLPIWSAIIFLVLLTPPMLTLMKSNTCTSRFKTADSSIFATMSECYTRVWGIYCQQAIPEFPARDSLRVAYFSLFISAIIVHCAYSASLISFLTVFIPVMPFTTPEEFAEDGSYQLIVFKESADYDLFRISPDKTLSRMRKLMPSSDKLPLTSKQGFDKVCRGKVAFYTSESVKAETASEIKCNVIHIETGRFDSLAITLTKGNPYTGLINYHLQRFQDYGTLNRIRGSHLVRAIEQDQSHPRVGLWGIAPLLAVVFGGMIFGLAVLAIERLYHLGKNRGLRFLDKRRLAPRNSARKFSKKSPQRADESQDDRTYFARYWP